MLAGNIKYNEALEKFSKIADIIDISGSLETKGKKDISKINILLNKAIKIKNEKNKKKIPLIDQHDKNGFWGGKFGGNFVPETLKNL